MIIYFAGNFPQQASHKKETEMKEYAKEHYGEYWRLTSFHFKKETNCMIKVKGEDYAEETS